MTVRLGVIGSAGRGDDAARMSRELYDLMFEVVKERVSAWGVDTAVSGGAALADHLAVRAYLEGVVSHLILFLPADFKSGAFVPNPQVQFNPGRTCNNYHRTFEAKTGINSLSQIAAAIEKGSEVHVFHGFHRRNSEVADHSDYLLAFTFGSKGAHDLKSGDKGFSNAKEAGLKDGGTAHTFGECWKAVAKSHYNLFDLRPQPVLKRDRDPADDIPLDDASGPRLLL